MFEEEAKEAILRIINTGIFDGEGEVNEDIYDVNEEN